ncbi:hypothetical protein C5B96_13705 [Subtercola sp. Z020]|uniref:C40 family peptidase n=1 Tax=Subtercola sp. Z020 TaxID=2080582 RepID=UPI000CE89D43|nr:NlpC/P60 family protein [Subtercola sp. Z020]PPF78995.1 hypothetical protein C5B96_13705 [Subtercola sp. Z020]
MSPSPRRAERSRAPWRVFLVGLSVTALAVAGTVTGGAPALADNYPSWSDVVAARANESSKQSEIDRLQGLNSGLQSQVAAAQAVADAAWSANEAAQDALAAGTLKAEQLRSQAADASAKADASRKQAAGLSAQFARSAGTDLSMKLLVSGEKSDNLLYQLGAMSKLSDTSKKVFDEATQDANAATSLSAQADDAEKALSTLADAAADSLTQAVNAQQGLKSALLEQEAHQDEMTVQLAALQSDTITTEAQYNAGVVAEQQRKLAEEQARAAAQAAADAAAAAAAAANQGSGGGGGGGASDDSSDSDSGSSSGGGNSGGGGGNSGSSSPRPAPIVDSPSQPFDGQAVVAYAEQYVGVVPYGWGANPNDSFGCDGLTQWVYGHFGVKLPRLVSAQTAMGVRVSSSEVRAGDLVVWPNAHVGIYDGHGGVIHSPDWGRYVTHNPGLWGSYIFIRIV